MHVCNSVYFMYLCVYVEGRKQVLESFFFGGGGASVGVSLGGASLFVSGMLLPFFFYTDESFQTLPISIADYIASY